MIAELVCGQRWLLVTLSVNEASLKVVLLCADFLKTDNGNLFSLCFQYFTCLMMILITQVAAGLVIYFQQEEVSVSYCLCLFPLDLFWGEQKTPRSALQLGFTIGRHN